MLRNKNIVLGIIIPLFFILISSNVLGETILSNDFINVEANYDVFDATKTDFDITINQTWDIIIFTIVDGIGFDWEEMGFTYYPISLNDYTTGTHTVSPNTILNGWNYDYIFKIELGDFPELEYGNFSLTEPTPIVGSKSLMFPPNVGLLTAYSAEYDETQPIEEDTHFKIDITSYGDYNSLDVIVYFEDTDGNFLKQLSPQNYDTIVGKAVWLPVGELPQDTEFNVRYYTRWKFSDSEYTNDYYSSLQSYNIMKTYRTPLTTKFEMISVDRINKQATFNWEAMLGDTNLTHFYMQYFEFGEWNTLVNFTTDDTYTKVFSEYETFKIRIIDNEDTVYFEENINLYGTDNEIPFYIENIELRKNYDGLIRNRFDVILDLTDTGLDGGYYYVDFDEYEIEYYNDNTTNIEFSFLQSFEGEFQNKIVYPLNLTMDYYEKHLYYDFNYTLERNDTWGTSVFNINNEIALDIILRDEVLFDINFGSNLFTSYLGDDLIQATVRARYTNFYNEEYYNISNMFYKTNIQFFDNGSWISPSPQFGEFVEDSSDYPYFYFPFYIDGLGWYYSHAIDIEFEVGQEKTLRTISFVGGEDASGQPYWFGANRITPPQTIYSENVSMYLTIPEMKITDKNIIDFENGIVEFYGEIENIMMFDIDLTYFADFEGNSINTYFLIQEKGSSTVTKIEAEFIEPIDLFPQIEEDAIILWSNYQEYIGHKFTYDDFEEGKQYQINMAYYIDDDYEILGENYIYTHRYPVSYALIFMRNSAQSYDLSLSERLIMSILFIGVVFGFVYVMTKIIFLSIVGSFIAFLLASYVGFIPFWLFLLSIVLFIIILFKYLTGG